MSEEKLFDVNWDQRKWETPAGTQDMKLYSYPPRTIRNMSVSGISDSAAVRHQLADFCIPHG